MTRFQLEASAHALCTSTTVGFGFAGWLASAAPAINSELMATAVAEMRSASERSLVAFMNVANTMLLQWVDSVLNRQVAHRGGQLIQGKLDGSTVTCPLHGSQFNVCSGDVLRGPAMDPLMTYRVVVDGDVGRVETASTGA